MLSSTKTFKILQLEFRDVCPQKICLENKPSAIVCMACPIIQCGSKTPVLKTKEFPYNRALMYFDFFQGGKMPVIK